jgi:hypothetical protein
VIVTEDLLSDSKKIFLYNFDPNWIPFDTEILRRKREVSINNILN